MLFKPGGQVSNVGKLLLVEVQAWILYFDQLSDGFLFSIHVDEQEKLRELLGHSKEVVNMTAVCTHFRLDSVLYFFYCTIEEFSIWSDILNQSIHGLYVFLDYLFETVVASVVPVFDAISHAHCVHTLVLASYFNVMHDLSKEFPSDRQIFRALRTWPDYKITDRLIFEHLDGLSSINVLVFWMRYSSEIRLDISDNKPFLFFVFLVLQNRLVFFFQLKPIIELFEKNTVFFVNSKRFLILILALVNKKTD